MPMLAPSYAEQMARVIVHATEIAQREALELRERGKDFAADRRDLAWRSEIRDICTKTLAHMQDQIDAFTNLEIERRRVTTQRHPLRHLTCPPLLP